MLVTGSPQFDTQNDFGEGDGVCAIQQSQWQWQFSMENTNPELLDFDFLGLDPILGNTFKRLRSVLQMTEDPIVLSTTDLHDLTCFILHRLLSLPPLTGSDSLSTNTSECLRYGVLLYMFIIHGPTYYSHAHVLHALVLQLQHHLGHLLSFSKNDSLIVWFLSIGAVASLGTNESQWFRWRAAGISIVLGVRCWGDVEKHLKRVLWLKAVPTWVIFQHTWEDIIMPNSSLYNSAHV